MVCWVFVVVGFVLFGVFLGGVGFFLVGGFICVFLFDCLFVFLDSSQKNTISYSRYSKAGFMLSIEGPQTDLYHLLLIFVA